MMALSRRFDLSGRPLLLLCGSDGGGKATLLAKSGLPCEYLYPDGSTMSRRETPVWFFSENAVYVSGIGDPGQTATLTKEGGQAKGGKNKSGKEKLPASRLEAFYAELKKNRLWKRRAIDGALLVADINDIIKSDGAQINTIAAGLRARADAIVAMTGYRIPVYFIFNKSDKIEGFRELFSDKEIVERIPCAGSLVYGDGTSKQSPKELFAAHYKKVYDVIADLCVQGAVNANRRELAEKQSGAFNDFADTVSADRQPPATANIAGKRAAICRLPQELLLAEGKLSALVEAFFRNSGRGRPLLGGFFFTSSMMGDAVESDKSTAFSNRVLFGEIIPGAKHSIKEAGEGTLFHRIKKICRGLLLILVWAILAVLIPGSGLRDAQHIRGTMAELSAIFEGEPSLEEQYTALATLLRSYEFLKDERMPPGRLVFRTGRARAAIMDVYIAAAREILAAPVAKNLEAAIMQRTERRGEPTAEEHQRLYRYLEAYLLLTGEYPPRAPAFDAEAVSGIVERSLKASLGQYYNSVNLKIIRENINAVIMFAAAGSLSVPSNDDVIAAAREKLARSPRAETIYAAAMESLRSSHNIVPIGRIAGKSEIVQHGREMSALYTRAGWEETVSGALIDAARDPFKNNWVTGPAKVSAEDDEKRLSELVTLYTHDLRRRWLDFIRSAAVNLPSDLMMLTGDLEKLSLQQSEIGRTLAIACSLATQPAPEEETNGEEPAKKLSMANLKAIHKQASDLVDKLRGDPLRDMPDPFDEAKNTFGPINEFLTGEGFLKYRNDLAELSKTIKQCAERGGFVAAFTPRSGETPISQARRNLAGAYVAMPTEAAGVAKRLLEAPFDHAVTVLTGAVAAELEDAWSGEVAAFFNEKLTARYPFDGKAPDVSYSDFEEFFKPQSGVIWKHIDKNLAGLIERTARSGWIPAASPRMPVSVSDNALRCINRADKIAEVFFRSDGAFQQNISFSPVASSVGSAHLTIGDKPLDFSGGLPVAVNRSSNASETVVLRITSIDRDIGELRFSGEWSFARLFDAAAIKPLARNRYDIRWSVNIQNMYTAHVTSIVQSNATALFDESIVRGFDVPARIMRK